MCCGKVQIQTDNTESCQVLFVVVIRAERLVLREFVEKDWKAVHSYAADPEVVQYMDWGPNTEEETKEFVKRSVQSQKEEPRRNFTLAVVLKASNELIGSCGINVSDPANREGWIGYCLRRTFWRSGYATEVAKALVDFGFSQLDLHRIFATCDPDNVASAHVLEKVGMHLEGHLREHKWSKGRWRDSLLYAVLDREWNDKK